MGRPMPPGGVDGLRRSCWRSPACSPGRCAGPAGRALDPLFARLQSTPDDQEAQAIEQRIWLIWSEAGAPDLAALMEEGVVALAQGRLRAALERFDRMVEQAPGFAEGWNKRATVHFLMGNYQASVGDIQRTLELEPRHFGALGSRPDLRRDRDQRRRCVASRRRLRSTLTSTRPGSGSKSSAASSAGPRPDAPGLTAAGRGGVAAGAGAPRAGPARRQEWPRAPGAGADRDGGGLAERRAYGRAPADHGRRRLDARPAGALDALRRPLLVAAAADGVGAHRPRRDRGARYRGGAARTSSRRRLAGLGWQVELAGLSADRAALLAEIQRVDRAAGPGRGGQPGAAPARRARPQHARGRRRGARLLSFYGRRCSPWSRSAVRPARLRRARPSRTDLRQRPADRRPDRVPDRGGHGVPGRRPAAALRRRDLHRRSARGLDPARDRHPADGDVVAGARAARSPRRSAR